MFPENFALVTRAVGKELLLLIQAAGKKSVTYGQFLKIESGHSFATFTEQTGNDELNLVITVEWSGDLILWGYTSHLAETWIHSETETLRVLCYLMQLVLRGMRDYKRSSWWLAQYYVLEERLVPVQ